MKITIEGEPKEIAAFELALKGSAEIKLDRKTIESAAQKASRFVPSFGIPLTDGRLTQEDVLAGGPPMDCPKK